MTLRTFYPEWFDYKWQDTNNSSYMHKIASDWKRFYEDDPIVDRPILELTTLELKNWARNKIISCKLSKKIYYNMAVIIRQSLDYLVELGEQQIKEYALQDFERNTELTTALAVVLNFSLGLRVGELVALKWKDLKEPYLHIRRMEQNSTSRTRTDHGIIILRWWSIPSQTQVTAPYTWYRLHWSYLPRSENTICNVAFPATQRTISLSIVAVALPPKPLTRSMSDTARNWAL